MTRRPRLLRAPARTRATALAAAVPALVLVTACGGGDPTASADQAAPAAASASASPSPSASPTVAGLPGAAANDDLSDLLCARDAAGTWVATGTLTNPTAAAADYRVTVAVAAPAGGAAPARRLVLPRLAPRTPTPFRLERLPVAAGDTPTCRVQVLRLR